MSAAKIKSLSKKINKARDAYYNSDAPIMSDAEFDKLIDQLKELDPKNPAVTNVGAPIRPSEWKKVVHSIPMGSLDKVNTPDELLDWSSDKSDNKWLVVEKIDGLSINCVYENGKLTQAITRGDGTTGENIVINVSKMEGVSNDIPGFNGSLRGEILMRNSVHKAHFADKSNPRNAASGVSKRLDGVDVDKLTVLFYQVLGSDTDFKTEEEQFKWLAKNKCLTPSFWSFKTIDEVSAHWRKYQDSIRSKQDYDVDGLVVRVSDFAKQIALGDKDLRPKGAIAFKFDNQMEETTILDITFQVGNTGRVTPVATVEPTLLVGATVTRASLYNMSNIKNLKLDIGAKVAICRGNDVIPVVSSLIKGTGTIMKAPTKCPVCNSKLEFEGEFLCCNNFSCSAQVAGRIKNWVNELNLLEWGETLIDRLVSSGLVKSVDQLYTLTHEELSNLERMGDKSATKCLDILHANKELDLDIFLGGLSIAMIGGSTIRLLIKAGYDSIEKIQKMSIEQMENISGIGPGRAESLYLGLRDNEDLIDNLLDHITIKERVKGVLTNKVCVFTGSMSLKRPVLEKMVTDAGGEVKSSVGKGVNFLIIADPNSTSSKAVAARKLGTKLISEEEFLEMVK